MFGIRQIIGDTGIVIAGKPARDAITSGPAMKVRDPILRLQPRAMAGLITEIVFDPCTATLAHVCHKREKVIINSGQIGITIVTQKDDQSGPTSFVLMPGEYEVIPAGIWHAIMNTSGETAILAVINSQAPESGDVQWEDDPPRPEQRVLPEIVSAPTPAASVATIDGAAAGLAGAQGTETPPETTS